YQRVESRRYQPVGAAPPRNQRLWEAAAGRLLGLDDQFRGCRWADLVRGRGRRTGEPLYDACPALLEVPLHRHSVRRTEPARTRNASPVLPVVKMRRRPADTPSEPSRTCHTLAGIPHAGPDDVHSDRLGSYGRGVAWEGKWVGRSGASVLLPTLPHSRRSPSRRTGP